LIHVADLLKHFSGEGEKTLIFGNGVIASMTSHLVDLTKNAMVRCVNCNETYLISCFANEYGYEQRTEKVINFCCDVDDLLIVISSSGRSENMLNGVRRHAMIIIKRDLCRHSFKITRYTSWNVTTIG
jgi:D-sedoheptulose 7-phosphate isomerase